MNPKTNTERILTGIQSSGIPHLGNLLGAIMPAIAHAKKTPQPALFFIANLHTLTSQQDPKKLLQHTQSTAAAWLACGLNTKKDLLYRQSMIPEVCELAWYLSCLTPYPMLANAHAFKTKAQNLVHINAGLFTYPVLMAADILLYQATHVPVGKDQQQHLEIARNIARSFNNTYTPILTVPQALIQEKIATIPGVDGRKMSKSYKNTVNIFATTQEITKAIMRIKTDNTPLGEPKNPDKCIVFQLFQTVASPSDTQTMRQHYLAGGYGYHHAKKELIQRILSTFSEQRQAFHHYAQSPETMHLLQASEQKARTIAQQTLRQIRATIGTA